MAIPRKAILGILGASGVGLFTALEYSVNAASNLTLHPPKYKWPHSRIFQSLDHAAIRRGYEVYKGVCSACHSLEFQAYRHMVDVCFTEAEAKAEAEEIQVVDGPDDDGNMFERPGKLFDSFPVPYPNELAARAANNGANPPDLSLIVRGRHGGEDYIYSLLTNYCDPPAGVEVPEGQYYNPYFAGGIISMAPPLYNEIIEYSDGTPATKSQLAKDVCSFLKWTADINYDKRAILALQTTIVLPLLLVVAWAANRRNFAVIKNRQIFYKQPKFDK